MSQFFTSTSRVLAALLFIALTTESAAQSFPLPYNPDENGDGLIGVVDLQGLLSNYGSEFSGTVISEDGENAITYMGEMAYPLCAMACENLPGMWRLPTIEQLGLVWDEVNDAQGSPNTYILSDPMGAEVNIGGGDGLFSLRVYNRNGYLYGSANAIQENKCYCAARQLPRVDYSYCEGPFIQDCASEKLLEGWLPLQGITSHHRYPGAGSVQGVEWQWKVQAFWRWAE